MSEPFVRRSRPLSRGGLDAVMQKLGVGEEHIWTVLSVETKACGFYSDRRPQILYERHLFHRLTAGRFDDGDISDPSPGGYGADGAHQYDRLNAAIALDREAALRSASWGLAQVLGDNCRIAGYSDVESMVADVCDSEDAHLAAFAGFVDSRGITGALANEQWERFASVYNGSSYKENHYDTNLRDAFTRFSAGPLPDLQLRAAQVYLNFCGFSTRGVDGRYGKFTRDALLQFQAKSGLPATGELDPATFSRLESCLDSD